MSLHPRRVPDWVRDIRDAIEHIHLDIGSLNRHAFEADGKTVRAVTKSIPDIGEAANQIMQAMPHLQTEYPDIWQHLKRVYAMRNVLLHGYFRTDVLLCPCCKLGRLRCIAVLVGQPGLPAPGGRATSVHQCRGPL